MSIINYIFSLLCSQDPLRSFAIDGHLLPFCQRCTGVYLGLGISFFYLLLSRHYKKGLPPASVIYINIASLLIMPLFGFHLLDPGPAWRFWSGLIYGNAIASLLLPATSIICNRGRAFGQYTKTSTLWFFVLFVFLNTIPLWFPIQSMLFYYLILMFAFTGLFCVLFCLIAITVFCVKRVIASLILKGLNNGYAKNDTCHRY
jgi:uncharacterized membrane protein